MSILDAVDNGRVRLDQKVRIGPEDLVVFHQPLASRVQAEGAISVKSYQQPRRDQRQQVLEAALLKKALRYDKSGEEHYNLASAFIKSLRGSDPDAALYWAVRMIDGGEDPRFVLRRMIICASEDIGLADSRALEIAVAADRAFERLGVPEGLIPLAHAVTYLAVAPKSKAAYRALRAVQEAVQQHGTLAVPMRLRNAPTAAMKEWGYGEGYRDPQATDEGFVAERYLQEAFLTKLTKASLEPLRQAASDIAAIDEPTAQQGIPRLSQMIATSLGIIVVSVGSTGNGQAEPLQLEALLQAA